MNLKEYRTVFTACGLVLILVAAAPIISLIVPLPHGIERFSELWILGPHRLAEDFPFNIRANTTYSIFVGVGNHMGSPSYYMISVKFRNQTQPPPDIQSSKPSPLPSLYEFRVLVADDHAWDSPVIFAIKDVSFQDDSALVSGILINDIVFPVDCYSRWDSVNHGYYYQLFFELWLYNMASKSFQYHDRFAGIWLNMTSDQ